MEWEKNLKSLIEKAWALNERISDEIHCYNCVGFRCSCNGFAEDPGAERESLIAIREALLVVKNLLLCLQTMQSKQRAEHHRALMQLEESRSFLLKMIEKHPGRTLNAIQEMLAFLGNEINSINQFSTNPVIDTFHHTKQTSAIRTTKSRNGLIGFLNSCIQVLSYPLKLPIAVGKIAGLAITAVVVVSVINFHQINLEHDFNRSGIMHRVLTCYRKDENSHMNSTQSRETSSPQCVANSCLDVLRGRG